MFLQIRAHSLVVAVWVLSSLQHFHLSESHVTPQHFNKSLAKILNILWEQRSIFSILLTRQLWWIVAWMLELIIFQVGIFKLTFTGIFSRMESTKHRARQPTMGSLTHGAHAVILGLTARGLQRKQVYKPKSSQG